MDDFSFFDSDLYRKARDRQILLAIAEARSQLYDSPKTYNAMIGRVKDFDKNIAQSTIPYVTNTKLFESFSQGEAYLSLLYTFYVLFMHKLDIGDQIPENIDILPKGKVLYISQQILESSKELNVLKRKIRDLRNKMLDNKSKLLDPTKAELSKSMGSYTYDEFLESELYKSMKTY